MTTTNMFLNFGGKWDGPPFHQKGSSMETFQIIRVSAAKSTDFSSQHTGINGSNSVGHAHTIIP